MHEFSVLNKVISEKDKRITELERDVTKLSEELKKTRDAVEKKEKKILSVVSDVLALRCKVDELQRVNMKLFHENISTTLQNEWAGYISK